MMFSFSGKSVPRPGQMNANVLTWSRLFVKKMMVGNPSCSEPNTMSPPSAASPSPASKSTARLFAKLWAM